MSMRQLPPVTVAGFFNPISITISGNSDLIIDLKSHSCTLLSGGTINCWGGESKGQLGSGSRTLQHLKLYGQSGTQISYFSRVLVLVKGITNATAVSASRTGYSGHT